MEGQLWNRLMDLKEIPEILKPNIKSLWLYTYGTWLTVDTIMGIRTDSDEPLVKVHIQAVEFMPLHTIFSITVPHGAEKSKKFAAIIEGTRHTIKLEPGQKDGIKYDFPFDRNMNLVRTSSLRNLEFSTLQVHGEAADWKSAQERSTFFLQHGSPNESDNEITLGEIPTPENLKPENLEVKYDMDKELTDWRELKDLAENFDLQHTDNNLRNLFQANNDKTRSGLLNVLLTITEADWDRLNDERPLDMSEILDLNKLMKLRDNLDHSASNADLENLFTVYGEKSRQDFVNALVTSIDEKDYWEKMERRARRGGRKLKKKTPKKPKKN